MTRGVSVLNCCTHFGSEGRATGRWSGCRCALRRCRPPLPRRGRSSQGSSCFISLTLLQKHNPMPGPEVAPDLLAQAAAYDVEEAEAQARRDRRASFPNDAARALCLPLSLRCHSGPAAEGGTLVKGVRQGTASPPPAASPCCEPSRAAEVGAVDGTCEKAILTSPSPASPPTGRGAAGERSGQGGRRQSRRDGGRAALWR